jgi:hypothetical protein
MACGVRASKEPERALHTLGSETDPHGSRRRSRSASRAYSPYLSQKAQSRGNGGGVRQFSDQSGRWTPPWEKCVCNLQDKCKKKSCQKPTKNISQCIRMEKKTYTKNVWKNGMLSPHWSGLPYGMVGGWAASLALHDGPGRRTREIGAGRDLSLRHGRAGESRLLCGGVSDPGEMYQKMPESPP